MMGHYYSEMYSPPSEEKLKKQRERIAKECDDALVLISQLERHLIDEFSDKIPERFIENLQDLRNHVRVRRFVKC